MCGIAGILSKKGENVVPLVGSMLHCMVNRGPDGVGLVADDWVVRSNSISTMQLQNVSGKSALGHTRLAIVGGTCGAQPFCSCDGRIVLEHNGEIYNYKKIKKRLEKHHKFTTMTDSEVIVHLIEDHLCKNSLLGAIKKTVAELDGVYALAIQDKKTGEIALVRDRIGVRQLYYADRSKFVAFASERKALWKIGIKEPTRRILPGSAIIISQDGRLQSFQVADPIPQKVRIIHRTMASAVEAYRKALIDAMEKRVQDFQRIGIIFSGGIDSVLIAYLAARMVPEVICYTGGVTGSSDIVYARQIADKLGLKLKVCELDQEGVKRLVPEVMNVIEDSNAGQVEVALPVYCAVKLAHKDGIKVMLTGQGADELFGGYSWYAKVVEKEGYKMLRRHMTEDLLLLYKETLEREDKITMAHSIELREPFLDPEVIKMALATSLRLNVRGGSDSFGKHVHRKLAETLGIPRDIAYRIKEAAQHGSGMHGMLDAIARKHGFEDSTVPDIYLEELKVREKIGSSQRYGYLFVDGKIWVAEPHIQMYLDSILKKNVPRVELIATQE
ncbi:MAG TPA: asparagine synthase (glutamine-hydrolyzing) [Nitrososphaera sp.]|jgi:asparagine synthase (glutamine-hydrolysing)|nr:asparagine synthase (glutamine-hydrolyzing) [Nitrososphaera sp.]